MTSLAFAAAHMDTLVADKVASRNVAKDATL